jgi:hypothetical protein
MQRHHYLHNVALTLVLWCCCYYCSLSTIIVQEPDAETTDIQLLTVFASALEWIHSLAPMAYGLVPPSVGLAFPQLPAAPNSTQGAAIVAAAAAAAASAAAAAATAAAEAAAAVTSASMSTANSSRTAHSAEQHVASAAGATGSTAAATGISSVLSRKRSSVHVDATDRAASSAGSSSVVQERDASTRLRSVMMIVVLGQINGSRSCSTANAASTVHCESTCKLHSFTQHTAEPSKLSLRFILPQLTSQASPHSARWPCA